MSRILQGQWPRVLGKRRRPLVADMAFSNLSTACQSFHNTWLRPNHVLRLVDVVEENVELGIAAVVIPVKFSVTNAGSRQ